MRTPSRVRVLRAWPLCAALVLGLGAAVGCGAYSTFKDEPINCSVEDQYDFNPLTVSFACYCDSTPDASVGVTPETLDGVGLCGTQSAQVLFSNHCNDWGSTCGPNGNFGPLDESAYEGVSFWARAPGNVSKGFTFSLYDANNTDKSAGGNCTTYNIADGGVQGATITAFLDPSTGQPISGAAIGSRLPDECGNNHTNSYDYIMAVTSEWALYTIPWADFTQSAYPNRVPNPVLTDVGNVPGTGLLTTQLFSLGIRPPKEAPSALWIDKLGFYRRTRHDAGPDIQAPGADARPDVLAVGAEAGLDAPAAGPDAEPDVAAADADVDAEPDAAQM